MFALVMSEDRKSMQARRDEIIEALRVLPEQIRQVLTLDQQVLELAKTIYKQKSLLIMGRGYNFSTCLEGALKVKELSYMHCEGIMSGELKHGPLAMVDESLPVVMVVAKDPVYTKSLNALQQVVARAGKPIIVADENVPDSDLMNLKNVLRPFITSEPPQESIMDCCLTVTAYYNLRK
uniref:SIS domain-containing protein n=1 Tax=Romanomermis culicivorax TaxID=13658 RepID=A0A915IY60_ROMCU